ncbi:hypothetical protein ACP3V3_18815 [Vibrio sp. PNB22_3_1]|jgi:hypothetical protein|nr:hypothetical protein [Vibrio sp. PID17_43]PHJ40100.1 hypothetical protein AK965_18710 [Vibrio sp. PID17_43]RIZ51520.1 hypothetical protein AK966_16950 [Vibrio sp. PID23_8]
MHGFSVSLLLGSTFIAGLFSSEAHGQNVWWLAMLSNMPLVQFQQKLQQSVDWYQCDSQAGVNAYCLDDFKYYQQHLYGELTLRQDEIHLSFLTDYQAQTLSELILNLRKDGLVLSNMVIEKEQFDVVNALKEESPTQVDKDLILFINRYPQDAERHLDWRLADEFDSPLPRVKVRLLSDGEMIELKIIRF